MRYMFSVFFLIPWAACIAQDSSDFFSYEEYLKIKNTMFSDNGKCNVEKVLASSKKLNVSDNYYKLGDDSLPGYPLSKMKRPVLCMLSISSDMSFVGPNKNPQKKYRDNNVYDSFPKGKPVEEIIFMPPMRLRKLCDEYGIPAIDVSFTKKNGRLERIIGFDPNLASCALDVAKKIK